MTKSIEQYVYLIPQQDSNGIISWSSLYNGKFYAPTDFPSVTANNGKNEIYFTIFDPQNKIKFDGYGTNPDVSKALWLAPVLDPKNPPKKASGIYIDKKDFDQPDLSTDGLQLHLPDTNGRVKEYIYQLNFVDSTNSGLKVPSIDPDIKNGDGSPFFAAIAIYVGAALIGAMLTLVFVRFALGWRRAA